jgi:hypothetical protein
MLTDSKVSAFKPPAKCQQEYPDVKVTGLRLRVGAGGTKTWIFRARTGGRTINKKLGSYPGMDLTEAGTAALKLVAAIARGGSTEAVERTFGAVAGHWIKVVAKPKNDSWRLQERRLEMHVFPRGGIAGSSTSGARTSVTSSSDWKALPYPTECCPSSRRSSVSP